MSNFEKVINFMEIFGQEVKRNPEFPDDKTCELRLKLIKEEYNELEDAIKNKNLTEVADALTDILYVTYGAAAAFGFDIDECFAEVQRSNMSKLDENGKPLYREDGKIMKGPNYSEPDLENIVKKGICWLDNSDS